VAGRIIAYFAGETAAGASLIDRACTLNPNSAHAWIASGYVNYFLNRPEAAISAFHRAMRLSPLDPLGYVCITGLGLAHLIAGEYNDAMRWVDKALLERPRLVPAVRAKVAICGYLGCSDEAARWLGRLLELLPGETIASFNDFGATFLSPKVITILAEGLRKAGLPEE
jgi:adenylate cyclase